MNDVREAMERITSSFEPHGQVADLRARRDAVRTRRRVVAAVLALVTASGGSLLAVRAFSGRAPRAAPAVVTATWPASSSATSPAATGASARECPPPAAEDRAWSLSATSGHPGDTVDVSGVMQSEQYWLQLWWNANADQIADRVGPPPWPPEGPDLRVGPAGPGPVVKLASVVGPASGGECSYRSPFVVPDAPPGTYQLVVVEGASATSADNGYAVLQSTPGSVTFVVSG